MKTQTQKDSLIKKTVKEGPNFEEGLSNKYLSRLSNKSRSKEEIILYVLKILFFILKPHRSYSNIGISGITSIGYSQRLKAKLSTKWNGKMVLKLMLANSS